MSTSQTVKQALQAAIAIANSATGENDTNVTDAVLSLVSALNIAREEGGGIALPVLTNPADTADVASGKEYISGNGEKRTGTSTAADENTAAIEAVQTALGGTYANIGAAVAAALAWHGGSTISPTLFGRKMSSGSFTVGVTNGEKTVSFDSSIGNPYMIFVVGLPVEANASSRIGCLWFSSDAWAGSGTPDYNRTINITTVPAGTVIGSNTGTSGVIRDTNVVNNTFKIIPNETYPIRQGQTFYWLVLGDEA